MSTPLPSGSTPDYTMGFSDEFLRFLGKARVEENITFLKPHLKPGMRLLDLGCGPGQISMALARALAPGELYGIDMEPSQVELARQLASDLNCSNTVFEVADAASLPFNDNFFDAVAAYDVLAYIPDTSAVLSEARRVLKPGGIFSCREMIADASLVYPDTEALRRGWQIFADLLQADDGHPLIGKEIGAHLRESGFTDIRFSTVSQTYAEPHEVESLYDLVRGWFLSPQIMEPAQRYGVVLESDQQRLSADLDVWRDTAGAFAAFAFGQAVAVSP